jgi:hypothetical protein
MKIMTRRFADVCLLERALRETSDCGVEVNAAEKTMTVTWSRFAMNPNGFHVGYEKYQVVIPLIEKRSTERHRACEPWLADIDSDNVDVAVVSAPDDEFCTCEGTEDCECELYRSPRADDPNDADFMWQEWSHKLDLALAYPIGYLFTGIDWEIATVNE